MKRQAIAAWGALPALLFVGLSHARAESISWSYSWTVNPTAVTSNDGSLGKVTFLPSAGGPIIGSLDSGDGVLAATLEATAPAAGTAVFTNRGYDLAMHLTDNASNASTALTFSGVLSGGLGGNDALTNSFQGLTSKSVTLGANQYTVTVGLFVPPLPEVSGRLGANVTVTASGKSVPPPVASVPEPSALLLGWGGASLAGVWACWCRSRTRRESLQSA